ISNEQMMEMALVENIQREDLNAIEVALSYQNLMELCNYTQEQLSERVGKKRTTISNYLRLLRLPAEIQVALKDKKVDMGHARALIGIEDPISQLDIYNQIIKNSLSVRKVEELVRSLSEKKEIEKKEEESTSSLTPDDDEYSLLKEKLQSLFSSKVEIQKNNKGKGKISIPFKNDEELEKIMEIFDSLQK
ncbi:MAG TPA: ParB/RepB/Spo0J family partition protein, partial [Paludibacteraceae bacterium]|nr:ParB/RepB/Spo0J family partition protein [Paludibacteraceae bacterium]